MTKQKYVTQVRRIEGILFPLQTAFSQIALAFRCDQYTLKQRLQAEEHARNLAEENIQLELSRGRETLEVQQMNFNEDAREQAHIVCVYMYMCLFSDTEEPVSGQ